jgi:hypothetical protein
MSGMKLCAPILIDVLVLCAFLSAQAQYKTEVSTEATSAVDAVDASVHPEVDGQAQKVTPEVKRRQSTTALSIKKPLPATVVWPAHANIDTTSGDDEGPPSRAGMSYFRPEIERRRLRVPQTATSVASVDGRNDDSRRSRPWLLNSPRHHPLGGDGETSFISIPPVSDIGQTTAFGDPFGRAVSGLPTGAKPFSRRDPVTYRFQTTRKRDDQRARKPVTSMATKATFDSPAIKQRQRVRGN